MLRTCLSVAVIVLALGVSSVAAAGTATEQWTPMRPALLSFSLPVVTPVAAANWTFEGCWSPALGQPCADVFRDAQGDLWICKACGTTGKPSPGKCRRTSQAELDRGFWCS